MYLQIELATVVDYGKPFVSATYTFEGDGPLVFICYEIVEQVKAAIHAGYIPNVDAVVANQGFFQGGAWGSIRPP